MRRNTMRRKTLRSALLGCLLLWSAGTMLGCIAAPVVPPLGMLYTQVYAPLAPRGEVGSKRGTSSVTAFLGLVSTGDGSVRAAAANGGIQNVKLVDYQYENMFLVFQRYTTVVYGD
jgi:TRL-like protein family